MKYAGFCFLIFAIVPSVIVAQTPTPPEANTVSCDDCYRPAESKSCSDVSTREAGTCSQTIDLPGGGQGPRPCEERRAGNQLVYVCVSLDKEETWNPEQWLSRVRTAGDGETGQECYRFFSKVCVYSTRCTCVSNPDNFLDEICATSTIPGDHVPVLNRLYHYPSGPICNGSGTGTPVPDPPLPEAEELEEGGAIE